MKTDCVEWSKSKNRFGYGARWFQGKMTTAHRAAWVEAYGPVAKGVDVDHICRNRACVRLDHLRLLTHRDNLLMGNTIAGNNYRKDFCKRGHSLRGPNVYRDKNGGRECRICRAAQRAKYNSKGA